MHIWDILNKYELHIRYVFFSVIGVVLQMPRFREKRLEKVRQRCHEILHVEQSGADDVTESVQQWHAIKLYRCWSY